MIGYSLKHDLVRPPLNYLALSSFSLSAFEFMQKREKRKEKKGIAFETIWMNIGFVYLLQHYVL